MFYKQTRAYQKTECQFFNDKLMKFNKIAVDYI